MTRIMRDNGFCDYNKNDRLQGHNRFNFGC